MKRTKKNNQHKTVEKKQTSVKKEVQDTFLKKNLKYLFLILVLFLIIVDLYYSFFNNNNHNQELLFRVRKMFIIPSVILGLVSVYFDKIKISETINKLFRPKSNLKNNFFSRKEIFTMSFFILILGISAFTLFHKLDNFDIYSDEVQVTSGAAGYYHTGEFKQWDFVKGEPIKNNTYNRAKPHQWIVAQSYKIFGFNTWASRFPSALFGILLIIIMFFAGKFFLKENTIVLLAIFSFALYFDFLSLGRWARMYAMIYPLFLLSFLFLYKFLNGHTKLISKKLKNNSFITNYLNFNYLYLLPLLLLVILNLKIHQNTTILFLVFLIYSVVSVFVFPKEKKYITASIIALIILTIQIVNPYKVGFARVTFFEVQNYQHYAKILFGQPFSEYVNVIFIAVGIFILFIIKNESFKKKYLMLLIINALTYILFGYIFKYASHYRYVSFVTPLSVLLIFSSLFLTIKPLFNKYIQVLVIVLVMLSVSIKFTNNYNNLYIKNSISPARPSIAHKTIVKNHKKGEVIIRHYGPKIYLKGIDKNTKFIDIAQSKGVKSIYEIFEDFKKYKKGWLIWHTYYSWKLDKSLINYANLYFKKYHGKGIDNTGEEVFYFNDKMLYSTKEFKNFENLPTANLKLSNSYSYSFQLKIDSLTNATLFTQKNDSVNKIIFEVRNGKFIVSSNQRTVAEAQLPYNKTNTVVVLQDVKGEKTKFSIFINSIKQTEKEVKTQNDLVKFQINPFFNGKIDNIKLYDFVLSNKQMIEIEKDPKDSESIIAGNKEFSTLYLWKNVK